MHNRVSNFLEENNALYDMQFGFRAGRSCEQALLTANNEILSTLNKKQVALLLLIDFSKAFDMVDHKILLDKLEHYMVFAALRMNGSNPTFQTENNLFVSAENALQINP